MAEKAYLGVADMVRDLTDDPEIIEAIDDALDRQAVMRQLMAMRAKHGLSQSDVALAMQCSQSRVSKMEGSADDDLRFGDLRKYAQVVGCELKSAAVPTDMTPVDEVKCIASAMQDRLSRMAELAQCDEDIADGVATFLMQVQFNVSLSVAHVANKLPKNADGSPRIDVQVRRL